MEQINSFAAKLENFEIEISKKSKYIRDSKVKDNLRKFYIEWKKDIHSKLNSINIDKEVINKLDQNFNIFYELSKKSFFEKKKLKPRLKIVNDTILDDVIIKIKTTSSELKTVSLVLEDYIAKIQEKEEREFAFDAISCLAIHKRRPAIIMGWVLVMYSLYAKIKKIGFIKFNNAYNLRYGKKNPNFKQIKKLDDFEYFPDQEVIFICEDIGIIDRNERRVLIEDCLKLRNMSSHPGKYNPGVKATELYFEKIIDIVLSK